MAHWDSGDIHLFYVASRMSELRELADQERRARQAITHKPGRRGLRHRAGLLLIAAGVALLEPTARHRLS